MILCYWNSRCFWFILVLTHWSQEANFIKETPLLLHRDSASSQSSNSNRTSTLEASPESAPKDSVSVVLSGSLFFFPPSQHSHKADQLLRVKFQKSTSTQLSKHGEIGGGGSPLFTMVWDAARNKLWSMCQQPAQRLSSNTSKNELAASRKNTDLTSSHLSTSTQAK